MRDKFNAAANNKSYIEASKLSGLTFQDHNKFNELKALHQRALDDLKKQQEDKRASDIANEKTALLQEHPTLGYKPQHALTLQGSIASGALSLNELAAKNVDNRNAKAASALQKEQEQEQNELIDQLSEDRRPEDNDQRSGRPIDRDDVENASTISDEIGTDWHESMSADQLDALARAEEHGADEASQTEQEEFRESWSAEQLESATRGEEASSEGPQQGKHGEFRETWTAEDLEAAARSDGQATAPPQHQAESSLESETQRPADEHDPSRPDSNADHDLSR